MELHVQRLTKPDGRELVLYGRAPIDAAPAPAAGLAGPRASHLRWHPLRGEWIVYAAHRQARTFLPPPEWNPLAPSTDPAHPTEVPAGNWDVAVFENLFSALGNTAGTAPTETVATQPCPGRTEVVVFTQDRTASLSTLPLDHLEIVVAAWCDRTRALAALPGVAHVFPFENRGVEVGVTLHHPHGQIYAYPFVPPLFANQLAIQRAHLEQHGRGLLEMMLDDELADERRLLHVDDEVAVWVPACARWAYEVWIAPRRRLSSLALFDAADRRALARGLQVAVRKLDGLWQRPMPYVLAVHQAPVHGDHGYAHVHIEIYPWLRMPDRLKYLAGSEVAAGVFTADTLPEDKAAELAAVKVTHD